MKSIDKIVASKYPIRQTQCLWIDLSQDVPVMKVHTNGEWVPVGHSNYTVNNVIETTYEDLRGLRDNGKLTPGQQYRITDYHCTTTQENTTSADHQFDIIVTANDEKTLNENARAINHVIENPEYLGFKFTRKGDGEILRLMRDASRDVFPEEYDHKHFYAFRVNGGGEVVFTQIEIVNEAIDVYALDMGYIQPLLSKEFVEENYEVSTLYQEDYFKDCNLAAWGLKYCIDNNTERFAWAKPHQDMVIENEGSYYRRCPSKDIDDEYAYAFVGCYGREPYSFFEDGELIYTKSPIPEVGDLTLHIEYGSFGAVYDILREDGDSGNGVIYYMKDEWNNECPYDFKNIQFKRKLTDGEYDPENGTDTWVYTFHGNVYNLVDTIIHSNVDISVYNAALSAYTTDTGNEDGMAGCYRNVIKPCGNYNGEDWVWTKGYSLNDNVFLGNWHEGTEEDWHDSMSPRCNYLGDNCYRNTFGNRCSYNTLSNYCHDNTFGPDCFSNTLCNCYSNTFGISCSYKHLEYTRNKTSGISGPTPEFWFNDTKRF